MWLISILNFKIIFSSKRIKKKRAYKGKYSDYKKKKIKYIRKTWKKFK